MYAYWFATDGRILYRRTDLVPEAPRTWDELIAAAKAAEEKDPKVDGYLFNGGRWEGTTFDNLAHFWSQGGELVDEQGKPIFGEEPHRTYMLNEMNFLKETVDSGASPSGSPRSRTTPSSKRRPRRRRLRCSREATSSIRP